MSLFDAIKYPISYPPTEVELRALPNDLLVQWMIGVGFEFAPRKDWFGVDNAPVRATEYYNIAGNSRRKELQAEIESLKKMIKEYDESV